MWKDTVPGDHPGCWSRVGFSQVVEGLGPGIGNPKGCTLPLPGAGPGAGRWGAGSEAGKALCVSPEHRELPGLQRHLPGRAVAMPAAEGRRGAHPDQGFGRPTSLAGMLSSSCGGWGAVSHPGGRKGGPHAPQGQGLPSPEASAARSPDGPDPQPCDLQPPSPTPASAVRA